MRFLIVATARSGSNQLVDYINQTRVARCLGEIFKANYWLENNGSHRYINDCFAGTDEARKLHGSDLSLYWDTVSRGFAGPHKYIGAKLFYEHRQGEGFWLEIFQRNTTIIHLWRSQILNSFISLVRAETTNEWAVRDMHKLFDRVPRLAFDESRYLRYRSFCTANFRKIRAMGGESNNYHEIEYSSIADVHTIGPILNRIFNTGATYSPTLQKQAPEDPLENVENRAAAEKYLSDRLDRSL
jgi:hypothetical protein